jgi:Flagellar assembly protein T, C-terminal domain
MAVEGKVAKILGNNEIVINRGRGEGVRQGMLFEIFAPEGEEVWDPDTGETLGTVEDVKAKAEVTEVKEKLAVARIFDADSPFGAAGGAGFGDLQENIQRMFQQMFGENVQVQGFGTTGGSSEGPDLESMFGGPLEDVTKVQVGDAVREIRHR